MNKILVSGLALFHCAASALAAEAELYPAERNDRLVLYLDGGRLLEPKSGSGEIAVVNLQKRVSPTEFQRVFEKANEDYYHIQFRVVEKMPTSGVAIEVVDGNGADSLLIQPDACRAVVDVAALAKDNPTQNKLTERTRKQMLRAFVYLAGAGIVSPAGSLMDVMSDVSRLDAAKEEVPMELTQRFPEYLERSGVKPWQKTTYRDACQEGWAPKPKDVYQKKIWEEVHTPPSKPMKITYDKAKQKPVVK